MIVIVESDKKQESKNEAKYKQQQKKGKRNDLRYMNPRHSRLLPIGDF